MERINWVMINQEEKLSKDGWREKLSNDKLREETK